MSSDLESLLTDEDRNKLVTLIRNETSNSVPLWTVTAAGLAGAVALHLMLPAAGVVAATALAVVQFFAVLVAVVDHREGRIPNIYVKWALVSVLAAGALLSAVTGSTGKFWAALAAGLGVGVILALLSLLTGGIGMGDVKFLAVSSIALWMVAPLAVGVVVAISSAGVMLQSAVTRSPGGTPMAPWIAVALAPAALICTSF